MIKTLGGDWGSYLAWNKAIQFNFPLMIEKLNLGFMVYRGAQEQISSTYGNYSAIANLAASRSAGVPINACYYWHYPDGSQSYYLSLYKAAIERENPDFIGVDIEQTLILVNGVYQTVDPQKMSDTAQQLCEGLATLFPEKRVVPYTRQDIISHYSPPMKNWIGKFDGAWVAGWPDYGEESYELSWEQIAQLKMKSAYDGSIISVEDFDPPVLLGQTDTKIWQYSSRIRPPLQGFPYDHQYDWNVFYGSVEQMKQWINKKEIIPEMASTYNTNVIQASRAKILSLEPTQKLATGLSPKDLNIDAVIMPMASMHNYDGSHWKVLTEGTFPGRFDLFNNSGIPVLGRFDLDPGSMIKEQHIATEFENRPIRDNWILPKLIDAWHIGAWTWDTVLGKQGKWRDVKAIILSMVETEGFPAGTTTPDDWQRRIFEYVYFHLNILIDGGMVPKVPVVMYTGGWFLNLYKTNIAQMLANQKTKLYLQMGQWVNFSTGTFNALDELFAFPPADSFVFQVKDSTGKVAYTYPEGYFDRIIAHEFTGQYQKVKQIVDVNGNPTAVNLSLWCDTKDAMNQFLNVGVVPPVEPPVEPPIEPPADPLLEARVKALEDEDVLMKETLDRIEAYLKSIPKY